MREGKERGMQRDMYGGEPRAVREIRNKEGTRTGWEMYEQGVKFRAWKEMNRL